MSLILRNRPALSPFWLNTWFDRPSVSYNSTSTPAVNVKETDTAFELAVAAPGLDKGDFNLSVEDDKLTISVARETNDEASNERYTRKEFNFVSFKRSFYLPEHIHTEGISAVYENGVLKVNLPKQEVETPAVKQIEVA